MCVLYIPGLVYTTYISKASTVTHQTLIRGVIHWLQTATFANQVVKRQNILFLGKTNEKNKKKLGLLFPSLLRWVECDGGAGASHWLAHRITPGPGYEPLGDMTERRVVRHT